LNVNIQLERLLFRYALALVDLIVEKKECKKVRYGEITISTSSTFAGWLAVSMLVRNRHCINYIICKQVIRYDETYGHLFQPVYAANSIHMPVTFFSLIY